MAKTDTNVVIFYKGEYYEVPASVWKVKGLKMSPLTKAAIKATVDPKAPISYVGKTLRPQLPGGYSTVINLSAFLSKAGK